MDDPRYPLAPNANREVPLAGSDLNAPSQAAGRITSLAFTPNFGGILIPVVGGKQTFDGSAAPSQPGGSTGNPNADPQVWQVEIQPQANDNNNNIAVYWQLLWWVKGAPFRSPIRLLQLGSVGASALPYWTNENSQAVVASSVEVVFWAVTNQGVGAITNLPVSVSIAPAAFSTGAERFAWQWAQQLSGASGNVLDLAGNQFLQGVTVGQWKADLKTAATGNVPVWPMLFDTKVALVSGTTLPIRGGRLPALSSVGDPASYGDEFRPGLLVATQNLFFALSGTPDVFTTPAGAPAAVVDFKVGT